MVVGFGADGPQVFFIESRNWIFVYLYIDKLLPNLLTSSDAVQVTEFAIRYGIQSVMDLLD